MTMPRLADPTDYGNMPGDGPLRVGGQPAPPITQTDENLPSTVSDSAKRQQGALRVVRDCEAGPEHIRNQGQVYLPRDPGEKPRPYRDRLERSVFFNVFGETVVGLTGFVFSKDPVLQEDVPAQIAAHWENIDNAGTHGDVFCRDVFQDALVAGHAGILVDFPETGGTQTAVDEQVEIRPYWVPIMKDNIVSWRTTVIRGVTRLTQIVFRESTYIPSGEYGEKEQTAYRVLYIDELGAVRGKLLVVNPDQKTVTELRSWDYPTQSEIPFAEIVTSGRKSILESRPPLLDLAYMNIAHYQQWSDRAVSVHKTCVPIWVETGIDPDPDAGPGQPLPPIILGANVSRRFTNPQAKAGYESHSGQALSEVSKVIDELKADMASLGLAMLAPQKRAAETAKAKEIDKGASDSKLSVAARGLQDGLERALYFHAKYLKLDSGGSVEVNRDFQATKMDPATLSAYVQAVAAGMPIRVMFEAMQRGGLLDPDEDLNDLVGEADANAKAQADQAQIEAAAKLTTAQAMNGKPVQPPAAKAA